MPDRVFGAIPGILEGPVFVSRAALSKAGIRRPTQAGISGSQDSGSDSIVVSGEYFNLSEPLVRSARATLSEKVSHPVDG
jgi:hypothetical protein